MELEMTDYRIDADPQTPRGKDEQMTDGVEQLVAFLRGAGPLGGVWFSEQHPTEKGAFWWRKHLHTITALQAERDAALARVAELEAALPRAYERGRDDAADIGRMGIKDNGMAKSMAHFVEHRDWGLYRITCNTYAKKIRALTPPADLGKGVKDA
jgi:hypothetical protein